MIYSFTQIKFYYIYQKSLSLNHSENFSKSLIIHNLSKAVIKPNQQEVVECELLHLDSSFSNTSGIIEPSTQFEGKSGLCIMSSINELNDKCRTKIGVINLSPYSVTICAKTRVAIFIILTPKQSEYLKPLQPSILNNSICPSLNTLITDENKNVFKTYNDGFWFPTPENCSNPTKLTGIEKRIYDALKNLKQDEMLIPTLNKDNREQFLQKFNWKNSIFSKEQKKKMENFFCSQNFCSSQT